MNDMLEGCKGMTCYPLPQSETKDKDKQQTALGRNVKKRLSEAQLFYTQTFSRPLDDYCPRILHYKNNNSSGQLCLPSPTFLRSPAICPPSAPVPLSSTGGFTSLKALLTSTSFSPVSGPQTPSDTLPGDAVGLTIRAHCFHPRQARLRGPGPGVDL